MSQEDEYLVYSLTVVVAMYPALHRQNKLHEGREDVLETVKSLGISFRHCTGPASEVVFDVLRIAQTEFVFLRCHGFLENRTYPGRLSYDQTFILRRPSSETERYVTMKCWCLSYAVTK